MPNQAETTIFMVSDGTGDTGSRFIEAALHQFEAGPETRVRKFSQVRSKEDIDRCVALARDKTPALFYTLVDPELRSYLKKSCRKAQIHHLDMLGPVFSVLSTIFQVPPKGNSGVLHAVDERYFQRIDAIEFTLRHDDGRNPADIPHADIVLLGISRTSKTPTSVYLAQKGYKVCNIPIVMNMDIPKEVHQAEPSRVIGLTINPFRLSEIRRTRVNRLGAQIPAYTDPVSISLEVEHAERIFKRNRQWRVIDVTDRAIEETADRILTQLEGITRKVIR